MALDTQEKKELEKYFGTKKFYIRLGLLIVGIIVIVFLFRKMKIEHNVD
jgi:hypothetical protein